MARNLVIGVGPHCLRKMPSVEHTNSGGVGYAGRMSVDALRREFVKESILQEIILAELAERRELEPEVRRELGLEHAGPLSLGTRPGLQLTASSHHDTSPVRQGAQLHLHMPVLPEPCLVEGVMTPGGVLVPRVSVKDRIDEWYRTPWNKGFADEDMLIDWVSLFSLNFICLLYTHVENIEKIKFV